MAKISARGDTEAARYGNADGRLQVLTVKGRLLQKYSREGNYTLVAPPRGRTRWDAELAGARAEALGLEPQAVRR